MLPAPFHVPCDALSVEVRMAAPVIIGTAVLTGGAVLIVAVAALARLALPSGFVAVTTTRMALPTSSAPSV